MYVMIDNYDSFVYNLASYFEELGHPIVVKRSGELSMGDIEALNPEGIVISPGPKTPEDAAYSVQIIRHFQNIIPILGVCLGHQVIGYTFGACVKKGVRPMHGKVTPITHNGEGVFAGLPKTYEVTRYHSLVVSEEGLPEELEVTARSEDGAVMGIRHRDMPIYGVQFHPEAVLSEYGHELLENFHKICEEWGRR